MRVLTELRRKPCPLTYSSCGCSRYRSQYTFLRQHLVWCDRTVSPPTFLKLTIALSLRDRLSSPRAFVYRGVSSRHDIQRLSKYSATLSSYITNNPGMLRSLTPVSPGFSYFSRQRVECLSLLLYHVCQLLYTCIIFVRDSSVKVFYGACVSRPSRNLVHI